MDHGAITAVLTDDEAPWSTGTMQTTHFDILRGQPVTVFPGSPMTDPPLRLGHGEYIWPDGAEDSGIIDWDATGEWPAVKVVRETPGEKG